MTHSSDGIDVPDDWWRRSNVCRHFSHDLGRAAVPLLVVWDRGQEHQTEIFSGFLVLHGQRLMWMTAGHVIEHLREVVSSGVRVGAAKWLDSWSRREEMSVRVDLPSTLSHSISVNNSSLDYGVIGIRQNTASLLLANRAVRPFTEDMWVVPDTLDLIGRYAVGFPASLVETSEQKARTKIRGFVAGTLKVLPFAQLDRPEHDEFDEFWSDPDAIYGELLGYSDEQGLADVEVPGMSGGPIVGVSQAGDVADFWLVGIQRSWKPDRRLIRAEPFRKVRPLLDRLSTDVGG